MLILDGATDALRITGLPDGSYPTTVALWVKPNGVTGTIACFGNTTGTLDWASYDYTFATGAAVALYRFAGTDSTPTAAASMTNGAWGSYVSTAVGAADKKVWGNGILNSNAVNNGAWPAGIDAFLIGARERASGPENFFNGNVGWVSVHNIAADNAFAAAHAAGTDPRSLGGCTHLFKLIENSLDSVGSWAMVNVGTPTYNSNDNPPVFALEDMFDTRRDLQGLLRRSTRRSLERKRW